MSGEIQISSLFLSFFSQASTMKVQATTVILHERATFSMHPHFVESPTTNILAVILKWCDVSDWCHFTCMPQLTNS